MSFKVYPDQKLNVGVYDITHTGSGSAPSTVEFTLASNQPQINFTDEIRDLEIRQQGAAGQGTYFDSFSARCNSVGWLRFMNPGRINNVEFDPSNPWVRLVAGASFDFSHPLLTPSGLHSYRQICDDHNCNAWINTHHLMTTANLEAFADAFVGWDKKLIVEHSNEVWNSGFPQHSYSKTQLAAYTQTGETQNIQAWHADQTDIVGELFKTRLPGVDVRVVWASQLATPNFIVNSITRAIRPLTFIDGASGAPYVGGPWAGSLSRTLAEVTGMNDAEIVQKVREDFDNRVKALVLQWKSESQLRNWEFWLYEMGSHLSAHKNNPEKDGINARFITASQSTEMGDFYENEYLPWLRDNVNSIMMLYRDVGADAWGHWQHEQDAASPRASSWLALSV